MQAVLSMPKKKKMKKSDLNNKVVGDVLDAYKEPEEKVLVPVEVLPSEHRSAASPSPEEMDETWEEKEDKLDTENIGPETEKPVELKYQYKEEQWKPINPQEKKRYNREFLLRFQFISASLHKPEGLPYITDVVLDKANKTPLQPLDPGRLMNCGLDFTPSFANLVRAPPGGGRGPQSQRKEPRKIITSMSLNDHVQLNKAEKAWKPWVKKSRGDEDDPETIKTQELFRSVRSVLNKLTPEKFQELVKQVTDLNIDTEERFKGVIDLIFGKSHFRTQLLRRLPQHVPLPYWAPNGPVLRPNGENNKGEENIIEDPFHAARRSGPEKSKRGCWVLRRGELCPKTIDQIHKEAELEEHREQIKVQERLLSKKEPSRGKGGRMNLPQDKGWNTVPISTKNRPVDMSCLSKITKSGTLDFNNQLLAPGGKGLWGCWGQGSSGGSGAKTSTESDAGRPATSTLNRFSALQQSGPSSTSSSSSLDTGRRAPQRSSLSRDCSERDRDRFNRLDRQDSREDRDRGLYRTHVPVTKRSFNRESEDRSRAGDVRHVSSMTDDKPTLSEEELEKKSTAIIEEYLHINDLKAAVECVQELNSASVLFVFVRKTVGLMLERRNIDREHLGLLLHKLISTAILPPEQYYRG
ncbi:hypothetical protein AMELA_G00008870 [Ameiurus melas]|uniref:MI domain-containing protein n=1 Tax=Ameiurus melas TaxID=219545 RepID=A0A7J6BK92_AMEME|nr:hypothetical protein AMELA_G00008870 [Ameiurus melas]